VDDDSSTISRVQRDYRDVPLKVTTSATQQIEKECGLLLLAFSGEFRPQTPLSNPTIIACDFTDIPFNIERNEHCDSGPKEK